MFRLFVLLVAGIACTNAAVQHKSPVSNAAVPTEATMAKDTIVPPEYENGQLVKVEKSEDDWRQILSQEEFQVLRKEGTERAFTGDLWNDHRHGIFICAGCGLPLFSSETKFDSGTGWPSFFRPIAPDRIREVSDSSYGMTRVEVECARCGGHQGHVFPDGPAPTGLRYCINSVSLDFVKI